MEEEAASTQAECSSAQYGEKSYVKQPKLPVEKEGESSGPDFSNFQPERLRYTTYEACIKKGIINPQPFNLSGDKECVSGKSFFFPSGGESNENEWKLKKLESITVTFFRIVQRLGMLDSSSIVPRVLKRLIQVTEVQIGFPFDPDTAKHTALQLEKDGKADLGCSLNILVLGKSGVGKSATINSILNEEKARVNAFQPTTTTVKEIIGVVNGVKIRVFDTPGLKSSALEQSFNQKMLNSVKRFTRKYPIDVVLYVDRLDALARDLNDLPLLQTITKSLGFPIWCRTIVTLTHSASVPAELGPGGYDYFFSRWSSILEENISQAAGYQPLMGRISNLPIGFIDNHPRQRFITGSGGRRLDKRVRLIQLMVYCHSMKLLSEANSLSKPQDSLKPHTILTGLRIIPCMLSSMLQSLTCPKIVIKQGSGNGEWRGDLELGFNTPNQFSVGRNFKLGVRAGTNNMPSDQISVWTSSSEHLSFALASILPAAIFSIFQNQNLYPFGNMVEESYEELESYLNVVPIRTVDTEKYGFLLKDKADVIKGEGEEVLEVKNLTEEQNRNLEKLQSIRVKFLRLVYRLEMSLDNDSAVVNVLCRMKLMAEMQIGQNGQLFDLNTAKQIALQLEKDGKENLDFSLNILVLGKSGVGKSATINAIFGEEKVRVDAFHPATTTVKEIIGVVDGVKIRVFDTPGLKSLVVEQSFNRSILNSVKKFTKNNPVDILLYVDRLNAPDRYFNDLPLLSTITSSLGSSIWHRVVVTLTHASSLPPEVPSDSPSRFDSYVVGRSLILENYIRQAAGYLLNLCPLLNFPVCPIENHYSCQEDKINGKSWRNKLMIVCYSMKTLLEANLLIEPLHLVTSDTRSSPLPHILSSTLQSRVDGNEYEQISPFEMKKKGKYSGFDNGGCSDIAAGSSLAVILGENGSCMASFEIQKISKQLAYTITGETKLMDFRENKSVTGISLSFVKEKVVLGFKFKDWISVGKQYYLVVSGGTVQSENDVAYGANMKFQSRRLDYPIEQSQFGLSIMKFGGDLALGFNSLARFSIGSNYKVAVEAGINNKLSGRIGIQTSRSEHLFLALAGTLAISMYKKLYPGAGENKSTELN